MADFQRFIVYFKATGDGAVINRNDGAFIRGFPTLQAGNDYIAVADNISAATTLYGTGTLKVSTALVTIPRQAAALSIPMFYNEATSSLQITPVVAFPMRAAFTAYVARINQLNDLARSVSASHPRSHVTFAYNAIYGGHQAGWSIWHDTRLSAAEKLQWLQLQGQGPTDQRSGVQLYDPNRPQTFASVVALLNQSDFDSAVFDCFSFVNIDRANSNAMTRRTLLQSTRAGSGVFSQQDQGSGTPTDYIPTVFDLNDGEWVNDINV